jgi:hypothetical protein
MDEKDEGFAQRWSRLKRQAREQQRPEEPPAAAVPAEAPPVEDKKEERKEEAKPFDPADLPSVESLTKDSDYAPFMRPEVPEELRQKALRQLWATDPVLSSPDLFDMHNLDYNAVPTFPEGVRSLYRVGRGLIDAIEAEAEEAAARKAAESPPAPDAPAERITDVANEGDAATQQEETSKSPDSGAKNS